MVGQLIGPCQKAEFLRVSENCFVNRCRHFNAIAILDSLQKFQLNFRHFMGFQNLETKIWLSRIFIVRMRENQFDSGVVIGFIERQGRSLGEQSSSKAK